MYIDDQLIQEIRGEYIYCYNHLFRNPESKDIISSMEFTNQKLNNPVGNIDNSYQFSVNNNTTYTKNGITYIEKGYQNKPTIKANTLNIPLPFWFCKEYGLSLPIIALKYSIVYIDIELRPIQDLFLVHRTESVTIQNSNLVAQTQITREYLERPGDDFNISDYLNGKEWIINANLDITYIFLDNKERDNIVNNNNLYLIEQIQYRDLSNISGKNLIEMSLYHPTKEIIILPRRTDMQTVNNYTNYSNLDYKDIDYTSFQTYYTHLAKNAGNILENLGQFRSNANNDDITFNGNTIDGKKGFTIDDIKSLSSIWKTRTSVNIPTINRDNYSFYEKNIIEDIQIYFDGNKRLETKSEKYFSYVQKYQHHKNTNIDDVLLYSFSIDPMKTQPTGSCNFSEIKNIGFDITLKRPELYNEGFKYDLTFCIINHNILDVRHGNAGLVYANR